MSLQCRRSSLASLAAALGLSLVAIACVADTPGMPVEIDLARSGKDDGSSTGTIHLSRGDALGSVGATGSMACDSPGCHVRVEVAVTQDSAAPIDGARVHVADVIVERGLAQDPVELPLWVNLDRVERLDEWTEAGPHPHSAGGGYVSHRLAGLARRVRARVVRRTEVESIFVRLSASWSDGCESASDCRADETCLSESCAVPCVDDASCGGIVDTADVLDGWRGRCVAGGCAPVRDCDADVDCRAEQRCDPDAAACTPLDLEEEIASAYL